jgi:hypothetical protein
MKKLLTVTLSICLAFALAQLPFSVARGEPAGKPSGDVSPLSGSTCSEDLSRRNV